MDKPFTTDGCSGGMTWAWKTFAGRNPPWEGCCERHDKIYWEGGDAYSRFCADIDLAYGVAANGHRHWAVLMFLAVRIGGHPLLPFPWRWGYGWNERAGYAQQVVRLSK